MINPSLFSQNIFSGFGHLFTPVRHHIVYQTFSEIEIDGKANDPSWKHAAWTDDFIDIEGERMPTPLYRTRVKMLWDKKFLYILAEMEEPHVWAYYENRDQIVFHENDFEVFIDPNGDAQNYFEIEINAQNTIFDLFMPQPYRDGGTPLISWDTPGLKSSVYIEGTINDPTDTDNKWVVEMAIPFDALRLGSWDQTPKNGQLWKIDFSRVQWQTDKEDGVYERKKDPASGNFLSENNWVWSAPGLINMHFPERWGILQFSTNPVNGEEVEFQHPLYQGLHKYLWLAYYKQKKYFAENGKYALDLMEISLPEKIKTDTIETCNLELFATPHQFMLFLSTGNGAKMSIDEKGVIRNQK